MGFQVRGAYLGRPAPTVSPAGRLQDAAARILAAGTLPRCPHPDQPPRWYLPAGSLTSCPWWLTEWWLTEWWLTERLLTQGLLTERWLTRGAAAGDAGTGETGWPCATASESKPRATATTALTPYRAGSVSPACRSGPVPKAGDPVPQLVEGDDQARQPRRDADQPFLPETDRQRQQGRAAEAGQREGQHAQHGGPRRRTEIAAKAPASTNGSRW